jgi:hypothetical protein
MIGLMMCDKLCYLHPHCDQAVPTSFGSGTIYTIIKVGKWAYLLRKDRFHCFLVRNVCC